MVGDSVENEKMQTDLEKCFVTKWKPEIKLSYSSYYEWYKKTYL